MSNETQSPTDVPPYYLQMARHWRMGSQSSDAIRRKLIQRGLQPEQSMKIIELLDKEDHESGGGWAQGGYRNRLWVPLRSGGLMMGFAPGTKNPQARTWLIGYSLMLGMGGLALVINRLISSWMAICDILGYTFIAMGLMGLFMYAVTLLLGRFL